MYLCCITSQRNSHCLIRMAFVFPHIAPCFWEQPENRAAPFQCVACEAAYLRHCPPALGRSDPCNPRRSSPGGLLGAWRMLEGLDVWGEKTCSNSKENVLLKWFLKGTAEVLLHASFFPFLHRLVVLNEELLHQLKHIGWGFLDSLFLDRPRQIQTEVFAFIVPFQLPKEPLLEVLSIPNWLLSKNELALLDLLER